MYTQNGESYYDALQAQIQQAGRPALPFRKQLHLVEDSRLCARPRSFNDKLLKNIAGVTPGGTRPQAVNINWGYAFPTAAHSGSNQFTKQTLDDWHVEGIVTFYYGSPLAVTCSANGAPIGYWTGTPDTGGLPFRCQQNGPLFRLRAPHQLGGSTAPQLCYPFDTHELLSAWSQFARHWQRPTDHDLRPWSRKRRPQPYKEWRVFGRKAAPAAVSRRSMRFNHFNPQNPNMSLTLNYAGGANTNANFGAITAAALPGAPWCRFHPLHLLA